VNESGIYTVYKSVRIIQMITEIKSTKIFTVDSNCKYHWSKLPKFIKFMGENCIHFKFAADLRRANLSEADFRGADLIGVDLRGADLSEADLRGANLSGANLRVTDLSRANLSGANLSRADLSGTDLRVVDLSKAIIFGANLTRADGEKLIISDLIRVADIGSRKGTTIFYKTDKGIFVKCGCYNGFLEDFVKQVKEKYKGTRYKKEYLVAVELVKNRFE
jgi:hypothetical protein